ncbi:fungal-specific transcription factor domain-containing protein [Paraphoma chrysanthemicola]|uniref:Fungal-specific transcription factor domain-containing protein n=1 Tax=Paraphoma chrysanthemicola TaxID=798071 RepID=A0A8K0R2P0_9PLEO|nr:fungal-specific transcription factor domain-containing protein [Paraphoma chrysanthemicola]
MSYVPDVSLMVLSETPYEWPSPARARFLVKVAMSTICRYYHVIRKSAVRDNLEAAIKTGGNGDRLIVGKLLALFALGEVYSAKMASQEANFPGSAYFAQARRLVGEPMERPQLDAVEVTLLLAVYSLTLNRRHSAYHYASSAIRLGLIIGMQLNVPNHQSQDRSAAEHRVRLWWTAYVLDRICTTKIGLPVSISDDDIQVDLPSVLDANSLDKDDFGDVEYELRSIELSRISAASMVQIYLKRGHHNPFSQRVQATLKDLNKWMDILPARLQLKTEDSLTQENHVIYLHLRFNQVIVLATRPVLLHVLKMYKQAWTNNTDPRTALPDTAHTLAETCIQCARHSYQIVTDTWINGTFATFDYFHTQYLFSAATVLAISSLLSSSQSEEDKHRFENAVDLLRQLDQSGSLVAKEFCEHIDAMQKSMAAIREDTACQHISRPWPTAEQEAGAISSGFELTAGMALAVPSLQDFLADTELNTQIFDDSLFDSTQTLFWPEI